LHAWRDYESALGAAGCIASGDDGADIARTDVSDSSASQPPPSAPPTPPTMTPLTPDQQKLLELAQGDPSLELAMTQLLEVL
jgi:hypothetical protein